MLETVTQEQANRAVAARRKWQRTFGVGGWQTGVGRVTLWLWLWVTGN